MELKTIKDLKGILYGSEVVVVSRLKAKAVKWIKRDIAHYESDGFDSVTDMRQIAQWMKRFNITEEDLK